MHRLCRISAHFKWTQVSLADPARSAAATEPEHHDDNAPLLNTEQELQFRHDGFVNAGPILDDETISELSAELDRVLAIGSDGLHGAVSFTPFESSERPVIQIVNMWEASEAFARVCSHPKIVRIVRQLLGSDNFLLWHDQMQYKPPYHGGVTYWHQDSPAWPIILPNHMLSAWMPLDDALVENGCMWMVPGSHNWGDDDPYRDGTGGTRGIPTDGITGSLDDIFALNRNGTFSPPPTAEIQEVKAVPREVVRGECHFHHGLTWHASPKNTSPHGRRGYAIHFMPASTRFFAPGKHLCKQFVPADLPDGSPVALMGDHFPWVCKDGKPVQIKPPRVPNANSVGYTGAIADGGAMDGKRRQWKRDS